MRILVVDDVGYTRHYHVRLLQKFGHDVTSAESGAKALLMLEADQSIEIVLTDLIMREMDGVDLFLNAQKLDRTSDAGVALPPKFILMTALRPGSGGQQRDVERLRNAKELGFSDVLFKPIEPETLRLAIESAQKGMRVDKIDVLPHVGRLNDLMQKIRISNDLQAAGQLSTALRNNLDQLEELLLAAPC